MHKFLTNFYYIGFSFVCFIVKSNMKKQFPLAFFFFPWYFPKIKHNLKLLGKAID